MVARSAPRRRPAPRPEREHGRTSLGVLQPGLAPRPSANVGAFPISPSLSRTSARRWWARSRNDTRPRAAKEGRPRRRGNTRGAIRARLVETGGRSETCHSVKKNGENDRPEGRTSADSAARSLAEARRDLVQVCVTTTPSLAGARPRSPNLASLYAILSFMKGGARPSTSHRFSRYFDQSAVFFIPTFWASVLA